MIAFFLYGGMLLTVLPHEPGVSWQAHLGGAIAGAIAAVWLRRVDPSSPRKRYDWESDDVVPPIGDAAELELPRPDDVPVLWHRPATARVTRLEKVPRND
jgi:hypothetical protein